MKNKEVVFYRPIKLKISAYPKHQRDYISYLLEVLHWKDLCYKANGQDFIQLKWSYITKVIPRNQFRDILNLLTDTGVIEEDYTSVAGVKCRGYRLTEDYKTSRRTVCYNPVVNRRIQRLYRNNQAFCTINHRFLEGKLPSSRCNEGRIRMLANQLFPDPDERLTKEAYRLKLSQQIDRLVNGDHWLVPDRYGRCHTLITSLPRELRCCLSFDGKPLVGLDLVNSQPLIAGMCARRFHRSDWSRKRFLDRTFPIGVNPYNYRELAAAQDDSLDCPEDLQEYIRVCEKGQFYESFMKPGDDRNETKVKFYREVLFGRNKKKSLLRDRFDAKYPSMANVLAYLKKKEYKKSAWIFQNYEATLFIHAIVGRIRTELPQANIFTIHDSVLTTRNFVAPIKKIIMQEFAKLGVHPTLKEEVYQ